MAFSTFLTRSAPNSPIKPHAHPARVYTKRFGVSVVADPAKQFLAKFTSSHPPLPTPTVPQREMHLIVGEWGIFQAAKWTDDLVKF